MFKQFNEIYSNQLKNDSNEEVNSKYKVKTAALILHDIGSKDERKDWTEKFKSGEIDILFVYNMLQTGFDAPRLKKLYLGRVVKKHNLLQSLTRVNRTYGSHRYGYVVDFADITSEFEETNKAYFEELQSELGDDFVEYSNLFKKPEEIKKEIGEIKNILFEFDTNNAEIFSQQINQINDRKKIIEVKKALSNARELYNIIRIQGDYVLLKQIDFQKLNILLIETSNHLNLLNLHEAISKKEDTSNILNIALENLIFTFTKIGQAELIIADQLKSTLQRTRESLANNFDKKDPNFILLKEELERLFKKKNLSEVSQIEMNKNINQLEMIFKKTKNLNDANDRIGNKYQGDKKFVRIHKRILEKHKRIKSEIVLHDALKSIKQVIDDQIFSNNQILMNEGYFEKMLMKHLVEKFQKDIDLDIEETINLNKLIASEYQNEFRLGPLN